MVNVACDASGSLIAYTPDGEEVVYNLGDISFIVTCMALVWLMVPGVGFFYSGLLRRKNALAMVYTSLASIAVVSFQVRFLITFNDHPFSHMNKISGSSGGYSIAFSDGANAFIGYLKYFGLKGILDQPSIGSSCIPALLFCIYQCMFAIITAALAVGAIAEHGRLGPILVFIFIWTTIVYDPIACWTWNGAGWSFVLGGLDFAGGTPVHISSGTAALAISIYLGKRRGYGTEHFAYKPHNTTYVVLGTVFLWFGWFGFNGGSALSANLRAIQACIVTNLAAAVSGITWMLWDYRIEKKWSAVGFCSGAIIPAVGYVGSPAAVLFGVIGGTVCNFATQLKFLIGYDDAPDIFATHGVGGIVGNLLTALFAQASVAGFDGVTEILGGWLDKNFIQLGYQVADSVAGFTYSFVITVNHVHLRLYIPVFIIRS
ncbi:hypothetical protein CVT24_002315 [Panaeolus cyanescens]|uniref:Ammonium transporter AmtB-like domain-containing protein n=1 Tax=Panaeolus cyanescens TaxID=181874 RepID=A0A409WUY8_9AGAR|nr:hypothetical protein CVT24_002315 [Panaeolus cyanescens]